MIRRHLTYSSIIFFIGLAILLAVNFIPKNSSEAVVIPAGDVLEYNIYNIDSNNFTAEELVSCTNKDGVSMYYGTARRIAEHSGCIQEGALKNAHECNQATGTWWIDLDMVKEGCFPACVVDIATKQAYSNYRCTGLLENP